MKLKILNLGNTYISTYREEVVLNEIFKFSLYVGASERTRDFLISR